MELSFTFCSQNAGITIGSTCTLCGKKQETHTEFCGALKSNHLDLQGGEGKVILELCIKRWIKIDWTKLTLEGAQPQDIVLFCKLYAMLFCNRKLTI